jgi:hypothetical protein
VLTQCHFCETYWDTEVNLVFVFTDYRSEAITVTLYPCQKPPDIIAVGARVAPWYSAGLRDGWLGVRFPERTRNFSLHHRVQTGSEARPASYPMGTRGSFAGSKVPGAWSWLIMSIYCPR